MSLRLSNEYEPRHDPLSIIEEVLEAYGWQFERDEDVALQCVAETRWGEMGALFAWRPEPAAIHYSVTIDVKPKGARREAIYKLVAMANERLWLGHFDFWAEEGVIIFRLTLPLDGRDEPSEGEVRAVMSASISAIDRFVPAFNFVIWAGKSPEEAIEAAMFETQGEA